MITVIGGGFTGQAGTACQGVAPRSRRCSARTQKRPAPPEARTLFQYGQKLRNFGYLTRDGRIKERKSTAARAIRKSFQFSKR